MQVCWRKNQIPTPIIYENFNLSGESQAHACAFHIAMTGIGHAIAILILYDLYKLLIKIISISQTLAMRFWSSHGSIH